VADRTFNTLQCTQFKTLVYLYPTVRMVAAVDAPILMKRSFSAPGAGGPTATTSLAAAPTTGPVQQLGDGYTASVARTGTGAWTFRLTDSYLYLVGCNITQFSSATGIATAFAVGVDTSSTDVTLSSGGLGGRIDIVLSDESGAADPGSVGDTYTFEFILGNAGEF
jgi:hypothetical protein